jgi:hypothetical protein
MPISLQNSHDWPWSPGYDDDRFAGVSFVILRRERRLGNGQPFIKVGRRIYCDPLDIARWLENQKVCKNPKQEKRRDTQREGAR